MTATEIIAEIEKAIHNFGEYALLDKGAWEVMDIASISDELKRMRASEAAAVLREVARGHKHGLFVASGILEEMEDWDALFEQPGIDAISNMEEPPGA